MAGSEAKISQHYHVISQFFPPIAGGLEQWTATFASFLSTRPARVTVHVWGGQTTLLDLESENLNISSITEDLLPWQSALTEASESKERIHSELFRISTLLTKGRVESYLCLAPRQKHILISNYATSSGFMAANIAVEFGLEHIACVVGTDFSRGVTVPAERAALQFAVNQANQVITFNRTQESILRQAFNLTHVHTIHPAVTSAAMDYCWKPDAVGRSALTVFSDTGYAIKKGTFILLRAIETLQTEGYPLKLVLCGPVARGETTCWEKIKAERSSDLIVLLDHMPLPFVWQSIEQCNIYASASVSEGCSHARTAALCIGAPIVTTRSGEMMDIEPEHPNVVLAQAGSQSAFTSALREMCDRILIGTVASEPEHQNAWREYFAECRELRQWRAILGWV